MLSIGDLINQIKSYNPNADFDLIKNHIIMGLMLTKASIEHQEKYILLILFRLLKL